MIWVVELCAVIKVSENRRMVVAESWANLASRRMLVP